MKIIATMISITLLSTLVSANEPMMNSQQFDTGWKPSKKTEYKNTKIAVHLNSLPNEDQMKKMLMSFGHMRNADQTVDVKVVVHGPAMDLFVKSKLSEAAKTFLDKSRAFGVQYLLCHNSMTTQKVAISELYEVKNEDIIPAAILELANLQKKGFAYIKFY